MALVHHASKTTFMLSDMYPLMSETDMRPTPLVGSVPLIVKN